jgi:hypothetical protein
VAGDRGGGPAHPIQRGRRAAAPFAHPDTAVEQAIGHAIQRRHAVGEVERLEDEPDGVCP